MTVFIATDHAGFELKNALIGFIRDELGYEVEDCGAHTFDADDDYPDYVSVAARKVALSPREHRGIVIGASGQGEAMVANRVKGVRAVVFYGAPVAEQTDSRGNNLSLIASSRAHNDANVLSLGARFLSFDEAKEAVSAWLSTDFSGDARHVRRIKKIDSET